MEVLWMCLAVFTVICVSSVLVIGLVKFLLYISHGPKKGPMRSHWVPLQVYSGDDALDHPDLQKISALQAELQSQKIPDTEE